MKALHIIAHVLLWVGGLNWGLIGLSMLTGGNGMDWNVVHMVVGSWPTLESAVYVLVGLAAIWAIVGHTKECKVCRA